MIINADAHIEILTGDCRELIKQIPDHSVDLIFTDPPYLTEYLPLYGWLGEIAPRVLKPTGFLACYVGIYHLADAIKAIGNNLEYFMELVIFKVGYGAMMWKRRVIGRHTSILLFRPLNGTSSPRCNIVSVFNGSGQDKRFHVWGQDEASARYYIDCLSAKDDMVLDPFCGGGTTPAMCKILNRNCISFEIDSKTADIARARVRDQQMPLISLSIPTEINYGNH